MLLEWKKNLSVDIPRLDEQHKDIFEKINLLFDAYKHNKGKTEVVKAIIFLEDYTLKHFMLEENLQKI